MKVHQFGKDGLERICVLAGGDKFQSEEIANWKGAFLAGDMLSGREAERMAPEGRLCGGSTGERTGKKKKGARLRRRPLQGEMAA
jgi:hypothetical protein